MTLTWLIRRLIRVSSARSSAYDPRPVQEESDRMSEVVVVGSFKAQPGKEAEALEAFKALVEPTHGEDGCSDVSGARPNGQHQPTA